MTPLPWSPIHAQVHRCLQQRALLPPGKRLLVAVSGGQDSLCLLKLLVDLQRLWRWSLAIAHCDHGWRADSAANAAHVAHLAEQWTLPYFGVTANPPTPTEAVARDWRYTELNRLCEQQGYPYLVTGHTATDRAETFLHHLLRGSGTRGLASLPWSRPLSSCVQLVRPLLELTRPETATFCQRFALPVWQDTTNADLHYTRNRLRQTILEPLRQSFNPQVDRHLAQTADLLAAEDDCLHQQAVQLRQQFQAGATLLRQAVAQLHPALQRRILWGFLQEHLPQTPCFAQVEELRHLLTAANRSRSSSLSHGITVVVEGDRLSLQRPSSEHTGPTTPATGDTTADADPRADSVQ